MKDKIKQLREQRKLSQIQLADLIGVSRQTIHSWESGQFSPTGQNLEALNHLFRKQLLPDQVSGLRQRLIALQKETAAVLSELDNMEVSHG